MRYSLIILIIALQSFELSAQKIEKYYDYDWKECDELTARFFSTIEKTDSGYYKIDFYIGTKSLYSIGLYADEKCSIRHGTYKSFYANKKPKLTGRYFNGKANGIFISYHYNGMMKDSGRFMFDKLSGEYLAWHSNGFIKDSISPIDAEKYVSISWYDDGTPSEAGYLINGEKWGVWQYFYKSNKIAAKVQYKNDEIVSASYYKEDGALVEGEPIIDSDATFSTKKFDSWKDYLDRKLFWPNGFKFQGGGKATIIVMFTINEQGKVEDAYIDIPLHEAFNENALHPIKNSPLWKPAIQFNRPVKHVVRQAVTFSQQE
ncbi:MAG: energy transducer TonB [Ferruginibacter sp.]|nr:energy transducer TonB [Ferruginibacter sp.]